MVMETLYPASSYMSSSYWTKEDNKKFERALAIYDKETPDRWHRVAEMIPGKSVFDVMQQYKELEEDVFDIEAGLVPIPGYLASSFTLEWVDNYSFDSLKKRSSSSSTARNSDHERKKGVPWTEDEHRRFLLGLIKHGKGDWRNISRNFVVTKTPTQVASHAQKYYNRQNSGVKEKRRPSIHDITTVNLGSSQTNPSDNNKPPSFLSQPKSTSTPKVVLDWNHQNIGGAEAVMVFNAAHHGSGNLFMPSPYEIASHGLKLQGQNLYGAHIGTYDSGFPVQSTRYQIRG